MKGIGNSFVRDAAGFWRCVEGVTLNLAAGRIQVAPGACFTPGTTYMGVDLAKLLEEEYEKFRAFADSAGQ